jgi:hypothetical protein
MPTGKAGWMGLAVAVVCVFTACSSSTLKQGKPGDAGTPRPDLGPNRDSLADRDTDDPLPDGNRDLRPTEPGADAKLARDAVAEVVPPLGGPDAPLSSRDGASADASIKTDNAGRDSRIVGRDAAFDGAPDGGARACTGTLTLGNPPLAKTGDMPNFVATADVNGDGRLDVVTANRWASTVSVLLGTGNGRFAAKVDYACGDNPNSVGAADVNGDGKLDLVTANRGSSTVSVLLGAGNGTFAKAVDYPAGAAPTSLAVGDVNGDGQLDIVTGNLHADPGSVSVLLGTGGGKFARNVDYPAGYAPEAAALADLDGDGALDIVAADWIGGANVLLGKGDGTFADRVVYPAKSFGPTSVALGDLDGDGKPDLVLLNSTSSVSVFLGKGDGTFASAVDYRVGQQEESDSPDGYPNGCYSQGALALGDVDGDGRLDILSANPGSADVSVLVGKGDGTFASRADYPSAGASTALALGDLNGDYAVDIVAADADTDVVAVLAGKGDGAFFVPNVVVYPTGDDAKTDAWIRSVVLGDLNGDGRLDLVVPNPGAAAVSVLLGQGDGTLASKRDFAVVDGPVSLALGDLNGDGKLDLVSASDTAAAASVLLGNGDGTFAAKADYPSAEGATSVALGDLNGDGRLDIAIANSGLSNSPPSVSVLLGRGDGGFAANVDYPTDEWTESVALGDLNGDGHLDIVTANVNGNTLSVLLGNGDGTFAAKVDYPTGNSASVAVADLDGDGSLDLVTPNYNQRAVSVMLGKGDGVFPTRVDYATVQPLDSVVLADMNGDGNLDIVGTSRNSDAVIVLLGQGDGTFGSELDYATGGRVFPLAVGDLNGDGRLDLVVAGKPGKVTVLLGSCE